MVVSEEAVGILCFRSDHEGLRAVVKQQFQDFVVHEITKNGTVVTIANSAESLLNSGKRKREQEFEEHEGEDEEGDELDPSELAAGFEELKACVGEELSRRVREFVSSRTKQERDGGPQPTERANIPCLTYPMVEKAERTFFHKWCKKYLPRYVTDTILEEISRETGDIEFRKRLIRIRPRDKLRPWNRRCRGKRRNFLMRRAPTRDNGSGGKEEKSSDESESKVDIASSGVADSQKDDTYDPRHDRSSRREGVSQSTYVSFVLCKENVDTTHAVALISSLLRLRRFSISHAGTKDKRAITYQQMRVRGVPPSRVRSLNRVLSRRRPRMAVGNVAVCSSADNVPLKLGDLSGNRFTLALRDITPIREAVHEKVSSGALGSEKYPLSNSKISNSTSEDLQKVEYVIRKAVENVQLRGFINYYGLQRFGSGASPTHETGYAVLSKNFKRACDLILQPVEHQFKKLPNSPDSPTTTLKLFHAGKVTAQEACRRLPKYMNIERRILESYAHNEKHGQSSYDYKAAFATLPLNLRKLYVHAVQSYLWNLMASARISVSSSPFAIAGDVIPSASHACDNGITGERLLASLATRKVTRQEEKENAVSLDKVILPLVGKGVSLNSVRGTWGEVGRKEIQEKSLDFENAPVELGLLGGWRRLIARPQDITVRIMRYEGQSEDLIGRVDEVGVGTGTRVGAVLSFSLRVAEYATMLVRELVKVDSSVATQRRIQDAANENTGNRSEDTQKAIANAQGVNEHRHLKEC